MDPHFSFFRGPIYPVASDTLHESEQDSGRRDLAGAPLIYSGPYCNFTFVSWVDGWTAFNPIPRKIGKLKHATPHKQHKNSSSNEAATTNTAEYYLLDNYYCTTTNTMGGDGGVIASNRRYMRGAGTADHTGDASAYSDKKQLDPTVWRQEANRMLRQCYISQQAFDASSIIVACPYGRLYLKEVALEALLQRKQHPHGDDNDDDDNNSNGGMLSHVRGLKDLRPVRFHWTAAAASSSSTDHKSGRDTKKQQQLLVPTCPITGRELNGQVPTFLIWPGGNSQQPNVLSENGCQMLSQLEEEYGLVEEKWRLAPPPTVLEQIQQEWQERLLQQQQQQKAKKKKSSKKDDKKRKRQEAKKESKQQLNVPEKKMKKSTTTTTTTLTDAARARVSAAVQTNKVLSSLFTTTTKTKTGN